VSFAVVNAGSDDPYTRPLCVLRLIAPKALLGLKFFKFFWAS
jgi:hypothetical protein